MGGQLGTAVDITHRGPLGNPFSAPPAAPHARRNPREVRELRERCREAYAFLVTSGVEAARSIAATHGLRVHEGLLRPDATVERNNELRRVAGLLAAGRDVSLLRGAAGRSHLVCHGDFLLRHLPALAATLPRDESTLVAAPTGAGQHPHTAGGGSRPREPSPEGRREVPPSPDVRPVNVGNVSRRAILSRPGHGRAGRGG